VCIITNPVNSTVPIARAIFQKAGVYDPARLFGVTTLDVCRANTFVAEKLGVSSESVSVPVVGGHAGATILPLLSQCSHNILGRLSALEAAALTTRIQNAGTEVVNAKAGAGARLAALPALLGSCARSHTGVACAGSATLSMAYAAYLFASACLKAMNGYAGIVECAYVDCNTVPGCSFFAQRVKLGRRGVVHKFGLGSLNADERAALDAATPQLISEIQKGLDFAPKPPAAAPAAIPATGRDTAGPITAPGGKLL